MEEDYEDDFVEKPLDEYTEDEIKEMFLSMFFWVAENRPSWLEEAIAKKKEQLKDYAKQAEELKKMGG